MTVCPCPPGLQESFEQSFGMQYNVIHRLETNKLRNVAKLYAHLLFTDALPWTCLEIIRLNQEQTTSSSRIFIKIVCQELAENMGLERLLARFNDPSYGVSFGGLFPKDNPKNTRFAINFFTSIGLGGLTYVPPPPPSSLPHTHSQETPFILCCAVCLRRRPAQR